MQVKPAAEEHTLPRVARVVRAGGFFAGAFLAAALRLPAAPFLSDGMGKLTTSVTCRRNAVQVELAVLISSAFAAWAKLS